MIQVFRTVKAYEGSSATASLISRPNSRDNATATPKTAYFMCVTYRRMFPCFTFRRRLAASRSVVPDPADPPALSVFRGSRSLCGRHPVLAFPARQRRPSRIRLPRNRAPAERTRAGVPRPRRPSVILVALSDGLALEIGHVERRHAHHGIRPSCCVTISSRLPAAVAPRPRFGRTFQCRGRARTMRQGPASLRPPGCLSRDSCAPPGRS